MRKNKEQNCKILTFHLSQIANFCILLINLNDSCNPILYMEARILFYSSSSRLYFVVSFFTTSSNVIVVNWVPEITIATQPFFDWIKQAGMQLCRGFYVSYLVQEVWKSCIILATDWKFYNVYHYFDVSILNKKARYFMKLHKFIKVTYLNL